MADYPVAKPASIAPDLTPEQRAALAPVDKLVQYIIPKLIDKMNMVAWRMDKLEWEMDQRLRGLQAVMHQAESLESRGGAVAVADMDTLVQRIEALEQRAEASSIIGVEELMQRIEALEAKPAKRTSRKKKEPAPEAQPVVPAVGTATDAVRQAQLDTGIAISSYADYDPDIDEWVPKVVDSMRMTGSLVNVIRKVGTVEAAQLGYSQAVIDFIAGLSPSAVVALMARFPE